MLSDSCSNVEKYCGVISSFGYGLHMNKSIELYFILSLLDGPLW